MSIRANCYYQIEDSDTFIETTKNFEDFFLKPINEVKKVLTKMVESSFKFHSLP